MLIGPTHALLAFVTLQRLGELVLARKNTLGLISRGGREIAASHYPAMICLHAAWIASLWLLAPSQPVKLGWFGVFAMLQCLRLWVLATLKERWTTRIIVLPGAPLIRSGPYRFMNHPNYIIVVGEIAVLPLCLGLPRLALIFSAINATVLCVRIRAENAALGRN